jgi:hypothetical protein
MRPSALRALHGIMWHALAAVLLLLSAGCVRVPTQLPAMKDAGIESFTAWELRDLVLQYASSFSQAAEALADSVRVATLNPEIQYRALRWKSVAVWNIREAALLSDPLLALIDVWLYAVQLHEFVLSPSPTYESITGAERTVALRLLDEQVQAARDGGCRLRRTRGRARGRHSRAAGGARGGGGGARVASAAPAAVPDPGALVGRRSLRSA